jgi:hypothetical protein|tara:strand:+ start:573 stop:734 length:162 start_codon:yes stop_codon:yes gene_type:complete
LNILHLTFHNNSNRNICITYLRGLEILEFTEDDITASGQLPQMGFFDVEKAEK